jgi:hypothetical protein
VLALKGVEPGDADGLCNLTGGDEVADLVIAAGGKEGGQTLGAEGDTGLCEGRVDGGAEALRASFANGVGERLVVAGGASAVGGHRGSRIIYSSPRWW